MTELKTLKDLTKNVDWGDANVDKPHPNQLLDDENIIMVGELRKEAIRWLKYINNTQDCDEGFLIGEDNIRQETWIGGESTPATPPDYAVELFIKHFFNISEADLK